MEVWYYWNKKVWWIQRWRFMKKFCEYLSEHTLKTINFEKKKTSQLTKEQKESCEKVKICYFAKKIWT